MTPDFADTDRIASYHAHIYYDAESRAEAKRLRLAMAKRFKLRIGRWHDVPVGPHPQAMYQIAFGVPEFRRLVPWLMLNRGSLSVLVHPNTGDEYRDHAHLSMWLGRRLPLRLEVLRKPAD